MPFQKINVHANHTLYFRHPGVRNNSPMAIATGANQIQWPYNLNTVQQPTFGGAVTQVLSTSVDAMTVSGQTRDNNQLKDIYEWFKEYGQIAGLNHREETGVLFQYPERDWGFYIQPTSMPGFKYGVDKITVEWSITAEVVADSAGDLNKATMSPFQGENRLFDPSLFNIGFIDRSPWSDPNGDPAALDAAANYADNFQGLLGAYASGDFAHWAYDVLARPQDNKINADSQSFWTNYLGSDFVSGARDNSSLGSSVFGSSSGKSALLNPDQNSFASGVASSTGLDFAVVAAWVHAEEPASADPVERGHNWLNVSANGGNSYSGVHLAGTNGQFSKFANVGDAITETSFWINTFSNYKSIADSASGSAAAQIEAIWKSPWDAGHYGGDGRNLRSSYQAIRAYGLTVSNTPTGNASSLAARILQHNNFSDLGGGTATADLRAAAQGAPARNDGGQPVSLDPRMLAGFLAALDKFRLGVSVVCSGHHDDGSRGHWGGHCVDISAVNGVAVNSGGRSGVLSLMQFYDGLAPIPYQLICGGVGNGGNDDGIISCMIASSKVVSSASAAISFYGQGTIDQHKNHVHLGY